LALNKKSLLVCPDHTLLTPSLKQTATLEDGKYNVETKAKKKKKAYA